MQNQDGSWSVYDRDLEMVVKDGLDSRQDAIEIINQLEVRV